MGLSMNPVVTASEARQKFSELVSTVAFAKSHVIVTRQGKEVAAVIPIEQLAILQEAIERLEDAYDLEMIAKDEGTKTLAWDDFVRELDE